MFIFDQSVNTNSTGTAQPLLTASEHKVKPFVHHINGPADGHTDGHHDGHVNGPSTEHSGIFDL